MPRRNVAAAASLALLLAGCYPFARRPAVVQTPAAPAPPAGGRRCVIDAPRAWRGRIRPRRSAS